MMLIMQSILIQFIIHVATCCTNLVDNELIIVAKQNEIIIHNLATLLNNDNLSQLILINSTNALKIQNEMTLSKYFQNSFQNIIKVKALKDFTNFYTLNSYILLNKNQDQYEIYINENQIAGSQGRIPKFSVQLFNISSLNYECKDLDFINIDTIIMDCYENEQNIFIINKNNEIFYIQNQFTQYFNQNSSLITINQEYFLRVLYYNNIIQTSLIEVYKFNVINNEFVLLYTIDDQFIQEYFSDDELQLMIIDVKYINNTLNILNKNQWYVNFNTQTFPEIVTINLIKFKDEIIEFDFHQLFKLNAFLTKDKLLLYQDAKLKTYISIDNQNEQSKLFFSRNYILIYNNQQLLMKNMYLEDMYNLKIIDAYIINDQYYDEVIFINNTLSQQILLVNDKLLIYQSNEIFNDFQEALLYQYISLIDFCMLNIKFKTIKMNETEIYIAKQKQFNIILNNEIESYQLSRFIDGPNITFEDINQFQYNNVSFSINFDQIEFRTIPQILNDKEVLYLKTLEIINGYIYYIQQIQSLDIYVYQCDYYLTYCQQRILIQNIDFSLILIEHCFFIYDYYIHLAIRNNEQIDILKLNGQSEFKEFCTIYPDQDQTILEFKFLNKYLYILQSNNNIRVFEINDYCSIIKTITKQIISKSGISWNPLTISVNSVSNILFIQSNNNIVLVQENNKKFFIMDIINIEFDFKIQILSSPTIFWIIDNEFKLIQSFNYQVFGNVYQKSQISLYELNVNNYIHSDESKYVYFYNNMISKGQIFIYNMEETSHNSFFGVLQNNVNVLNSYKNYLLIGDVSGYYLISNMISFTIYYKDIYSENYLAEVISQIQIKGYDQYIQYNFSSSLVNPYTSIIFHQNQLDLQGLIENAQSNSDCYDKYKWYTGQVVDMTLKSKQIKLKKPIHLLNQNITESGKDIKEFQNNSLLILYSTKMIKFNITTQVKQVFYFENNYQCQQISFLYQDLIFISCTNDGNSYILTYQCTDEFICTKKYDEIVGYYNLKTIQIFNDLIFIVTQIMIDIYRIDSNNLIYLQTILAQVQYYFQGILQITNNNLQLLILRQNVLYLHSYKYIDNQFKFIEISQINLENQLNILKYYVNPKSEFSNIIIKTQNIQNQVISAELLLQSQKYSHYIILFQQICDQDNNLCHINNFQVLSIIQSYSTWQSNYAYIYKEQYLLIIYNQATSYLAAFYNLNLNYINKVNIPTLFIGAIQYSNISNSQFCLFNNNNQIQLLSNIDDITVYSLYRIYPTTQFCIINSIQQETVKLYLKNNFDSQEYSLNIDFEDNSNKSKAKIIWILIVIGLILLTLAILIGFYMIKKKKQNSNQLLE